MNHLAAFAFTASNTGAGTFVQVPGVVDTYLAVQPDGHFIIPAGALGASQGLKLWMAHAMGTGTSVARVDNRRLAATMFPEVNPVNATAANVSAFWYQEFGPSGPVIPINDMFGLQADNTGANVQTGFVMLHDGVLNVPTGERFTLRALAVNAGSSTQATTVANTWTAATLLLQQQLAVGKYSCIGIDAIGTTLLGVRIIPPAGGMRPGAWVRAAQTVFSTGQFRNGKQGALTEFYSYAPPVIELLDSAAVTAAFTVWLDLVKVG